MPKFITDFREDLTDNKGNILYPRFSYWEYDFKKRKHQVKDTSSNLNELLEKHGALLVVDIQGIVLNA